MSNEIASLKIKGMPYLLLILLLTSVTTSHAYTGCWFRIIKNMNFGNYNPFRPSADRAYGKVEVRCYENKYYRLKVALSPGFSGSYQPRGMLKTDDKNERLLYNIYTNATRTIIWGDGSGGTSAKYTNRQGPFTKRYGLYGKIPPLQTHVKVGSYSDQVYVSLYF